MVQLSTFSSSVFNALPPPRVPKNRDEHTASLLAIIKQHGFGKLFGVSLNHNHFPVKDTAPVTITEMSTQHIQLLPSQEEGALPYMFLFRGDALVPLQYISKRVAPTVVSTVNEQLASVAQHAGLQAFVQAYNQYLLTHQVQGDFGIIINLIEPFNLTPEQTLLEMTNQATCEQFFFMNSIEYVDRDMKTQWYINPNSDDDQPLHCFCGTSQMRCHK